MFILNKNGVLHPYVEQDNDPISCSGKLIKGKRSTRCVRERRAV
ncbi:hypothetical protein [Clostridium phage Maintenon]|nr:hypothetical protein [Clostridium phage Maintenon]